MNDDTLFEFPCRFPIKAMGHSDQDLEQIVRDCLQRHAVDMQEVVIDKRHSSAGKYLSITATLTATSKQQLDEIYLCLNAHAQILMTL